VIIAIAKRKKMETADILIVDDDPQISKSISRALKKYKHKIVSAQSGEEALQYVSEIRFKVIISDVKMSKMHGFELLDKIHMMNPDITRIVLSGHPDVELILKLVNEKGIDKYITKPWRNADLILAINKCIELYDLRRAASKKSFC
jgi:response regulator RpfG family c-di-GMP phosphodiesterase